MGLLRALADVASAVLRSTPEKPATRVALNGQAAAHVLDRDRSYIIARTALCAGPVGHTSANYNAALTLLDKAKFRRDCLASRMSDLKPKLTALLREYATNGRGPFATRVNERRLQPDSLTDRELRNHLSMSYGALLHDLNQVGLSAFYMKDLSQVVGRDRAVMVMAATEPTRPAPYKPMAKWKIWVPIVAVVLIGFQISHYTTMAAWRPRIAAMALTSDAWLRTYKSDETPDAVREEMFDQAIASVADIPVYSPLWLSLSLDPDLPEEVDAQMDRLSDAHAARLQAQQDRQSAEARRRCMRAGDSWSRYDCLGKLGVWRDVERTTRMMTGGDPDAPSIFPRF